MGSNFAYYSAVGCNAVAVFDSWARLQLNKKYFRKLAVKGFDTFEEAENWALLQFDDYVGPFEDPPAQLPLNVVCHKHKMIG